MSTVRRIRADESLAYVIGEIHWLLGTDSIDSIAHRLGYASTTSLAKWLYRRGQHDLARVFDERRHGLEWAHEEVA